MKAIFEGTALESASDWLKQDVLSDVYYKVVEYLDGLVTWKELRDTIDLGDLGDFCLNCGRIFEHGDTFNGTVTGDKITNAQCVGACQQGHQLTGVGYITGGRK